jgi:pullulanase
LALRAPPLPRPFTDDDRGPAGVVKWRNGELVPCDPGGEEPAWDNDPRLDALPANNRLVIFRSSIRKRRSTR